MVINSISFSIRATPEYCPPTPHNCLCGLGKLFTSLSLSQLKDDTIASLTGLLQGLNNLIEVKHSD